MELGEQDFAEEKLWQDGGARDYDRRHGGQEQLGGYTDNGILTERVVLQEADDMDMEQM